MKKKIILVLAAIIVMTAVIVALIMTDPKQKDNASPNTTQTFTGQIVCLPKPGDGPQTLECAIGLRASDKKYYALKNNPNQEIPVNTQVSVTGVVIPPSENEMYDIAGTIAVEKLEQN